MRIAKTLLAVGAMAMLAGTTLAQPPEGKGRPGLGGGMMGRGGGAMMLLGNSGVQEELKLSDEQKDKIKEVLKASREKMADLRDKDREERQAAMKEINEANEKAVKEVLKPEQSKRLNEIKWQQAGVQAFNDAEVQTALKITDDQKQKIKAITEEMDKDAREIFSSAGENPGEARTKMQALRKETKEKAMAVLTAEQKTAFEALLGKAFEVKMEGRPGGDGGGRPKNGRPKGEGKPKVDD